MKLEVRLLDSVDDHRSIDVDLVHFWDMKDMRCKQNDEQAPGLVHVFPMLCFTNVRLIEKQALMYNDDLTGTKYASSDLVCAPSSWLRLVTTTLSPTHGAIFATAHL